MENANADFIETLSSRGLLIGRITQSMYPSLTTTRMTAFNCELRRRDLQRPGYVDSGRSPTFHRS